MESFKQKFTDLMLSLPDTPPIRGYTPANYNSIPTSSHNFTQDRDTTINSTSRCQKIGTKKFPDVVYLDLADQSLTSGAKPHTHDPGNLVYENGSSGKL